MKQLLTGVVTLILGFFTLVFAAVFGLIISLSALIAKPFLMRKIRKAQEQQFAQQREQKDFASYSSVKESRANSNGRVIDGDFQDITDSR